MLRLRSGPPGSICRPEKIWYEIPACSRYRRPEQKGDMIMNTREDLPGIVRNGVYFVRWTLISLLMGTVCGLVGTAFGFGVAYSQQFFRENPFMLFLMPVSGILIVLVHKALDQVGNKGTNLILESISSTEQIRFSTLPCIFISTIRAI